MRVERDTGLIAPERVFKIAYGASSNSKVWKNSTVTWSGFCARLEKAVHTRETSAEYAAMTSDERARVKNCGGYVPGYLRDKRRLAGNVESRSMLTFDADEAKKGFAEEFAGKFPFASVLYSTHSHTDESPRFRIVIPLKEDITPDRFTAAERLLSSEMGIEQFDPCSYQPNQPMYWPSVSRDGKYVRRVTEGPFFDANAYLERFPDWRDFTKLPVSPREKELRSSEGKKQEDPLLKEGIVGAFCRTYSITSAIEKFLSDVYAPSDCGDRFDYIPGEGKAGLVLYEDKFAYSHHATDPACGMLLNAFDLVRVHRFGQDPKESFKAMSAFAEADEQVRERLERESAEKAKKDFEAITSSWDDPIPLGGYTVPPFPADALPPDIGDYAAAVAESTQTPVDMAGTAALAAIAACAQGKFQIQGKSDWVEPLNGYFIVINPPSERKSAVERAMIRPLDEYEERYNKEHAMNVEAGRMRRQALEKRRKAVENSLSNGKATEEELEAVSRELAEFKEEKPLRLYADDVTTEKLISIMSENGGRAAIISSEGGIFDTLAGIYTKNVNIDVMLKGYSGDPIRVDRIGRDSESVMHPCLTVLLMAQPNVISSVMQNTTFRGRGLTARFLYSLPGSKIGSRKFNSLPVAEELYIQYSRKMVNILEEEHPVETVTLSPEAFSVLTAFADEIEARLAGDLEQMSDWAGKLTGSVLRISGLLCRAGVYRSFDFFGENEPLVVDGATMRNAVRLGRYFLAHAQAVYSVMPADTSFRQAALVMKAVAGKNLKEFTRRDIMRLCRTFKTADEIQPVLDFLEDYGYIAQIPQKYPGAGRPPQPRYAVNPAGLEMFCPFVNAQSRGFGTEKEVSNR